MANSFEDVISQIKDRLDIVDVVSQYVVLKKSGANYLGICPFHNDKKPSMSVSPSRGIFKCFSCGAGGDALAFLVKIQNREYKDVIMELADKYGIELPKKYGASSETKSLKKDYEVFLKNNHHTKIVLLPNILINNVTSQSDLKHKNIISVSRLDKGKKIDDLITIFSKLKNQDSKLYIIGNGTEMNNLKNLTKNLGITERVTFTGYLSHREQEKYYLDSSIFAMTSISEGLPMVLLEAMSYGLPCIAYKTDSGIEDIISNNENGFIIKSRNEKEYVEKLDAILNNSKEVKKLGANALKTTKNFEPDEILKIWNKILQ